MSARIELTVVSGSGPQRRYVFSEPQTCVIGRVPECAIILPATLENCDVSRRHCALEIDPPFVRVRDLGSLNGTYINGELIGGRWARRPQTEPVDEHSWFPLRDGDELRLGQHAVFRVDVHEFVVDEEPSEKNEKVGSGTFTACPD
jgi:eukaryotic-like serine/threonine-protein kinase